MTEPTPPSTLLTHDLSAHTPMMQHATPSWSAVKTKLSNFDHAGLICLVQDLYATNKDTRTSLHARLRLGGDALAPYEATIDRGLWPDVLQQQGTSVAKAKKAIAGCKMGVVHGRWAG